MKKTIKLLFIPLGILLAAAIAVGTVLAVIGSKARHTVTFESNGGTPVESYVLRAGDSIARPADPSKELFTFAGWYADGVFSEEFDFSQKMPDRDITIYARWAGTRSTRIEYDSMGGTAVDPSVGVVGSKLTAPQEPTREGYKFGGWYTDPECTAFFPFTVFPDENTTLYARWDTDPENYAYITYNGNGELLATVPVAKGTQIAEPAFFGAEEGVTVDGWYTDAALTRKYTFGAAGNDLTLYASYYSAGLNIEDGTVKSYSGANATVYIPNRYEGSIVSSVGNYTFAENDSVKSVVLPAGTVNAIGEGAFYRCEYLTTVNLAPTLKTIGKNAFFNCVRLTSYGDITGVTALPEGLFLGCKKLSAVTLSENVTSIGGQAFADCSSITELVIPDRVTFMGDGLLDGCSSLAKLTLPKGLRTLGERVFAGCGSLAEIVLDASNTSYKLIDGSLYQSSGNRLIFYVPGTDGGKSFTLPDEAKSIAEGAFDGNTTLEELTVPQGIVIARGAFANMKGLVTLTVERLDSNYLASYFGAKKEESGTYSLYIPETLRTVTLTGSPSAVAAYAFYGARGLSRVNGLDNIKSVGQFAFAYTSLETFEVSALLDSIGDRAFAGCNSFAEYTMSAPSSYYSVHDGCLYNGAGTTLLSVPSAKTAVEFAESINQIASYAFTDSMVRSVAVPGTVTEIGLAAFNNCPALTELSVPFLGGTATSNRYLGYIFGSTVNLTDSNEEEGVPSHKNLSMNNGTPSGSLAKFKLTSALPDTTLPDAAFAGFSSLSEVSLPEGTRITQYGAYCFYSTAIAAWDISEATEIGDFAFSLSALRSVSVPAAVKTVRYASFARISALESIQLAEGIEEIAPQAFRAYSMTLSSSEWGMEFTSNVTTKVTIPASVKKIGAEAFYGLGTGSDRTQAQEGIYDAAVEFTDGENLTEIGDSAFAYSSLRSVSIPASVTKLGAQAFLYCEELETVTIGTAQKASALATLGTLCFANCTKLVSLTMYVDAVVPMAQYENTGTDEETEMWDIFHGSSEEFHIYLPAAVIGGYREADGWKVYADRIQQIAGE